MTNMGDGGDKVLAPAIVALLRKLNQPVRTARAFTADERRLAIAILLATMVPADKKVLDVEIERLNDLASRHYRLSGISIDHIETLAREKTFTLAELDAISAHLTELLHIDDRCVLVGLLWEIALCDKHLHELEEQAIYAIADRMQVPRKRTLEQQAKAVNRV